jgi:hypothetical protein
MTPVAQSMLALDVGGVVVILSLFTNDQIIIVSAISMMLTLFLCLPVYVIGDWVHEKRTIHRRVKRVDDKTA